MKRNLLICDVSYRLQKQFWRHPGSGTCNGRDRIISVYADDPRAEADETLFHEIFHACEKELRATGQIPHESTEQYVEAMALALYTAMKRNGFLCMEIEWQQLELFQREEWEAVWSAVAQGKRDAARMAHSDTRTGAQGAAETGEG